MTECLPDIPAGSTVRQNTDGSWQYRRLTIGGPIPAPQAGLPWATDESAVQSREPASVATEARPLSLDAQAVLDAYYRAPCQNRLMIAAVLRAVANSWRGEIGPLPVTERTTGINDCADRLCEIAAELEVPNG
jgi:hypothetical protein